jgi:tryptophan synthase beta chain
MAAYESYLAGDLEDFEYPREAIAQSLANLPKIA